MKSFEQNLLENKLNEVIRQRKLYSSEHEFWKNCIFLMQRINELQGASLIRMLGGVQ